MANFVSPSKNFSLISTADLVLPASSCWKRMQVELHPVRAPGSGSCHKCEGRSCRFLIRIIIEWLSTHEHSQLASGLSNHPHSLNATLWLFTQGQLSRTHGDELLSLAVALLCNPQQSVSSVTFLRSKGVAYPSAGFANNPHLSSTLPSESVTHVAKSCGRGNGPLLLNILHSPCHTLPKSYTLNRCCGCNGCNEPNQDLC